MLEVLLLLSPIPFFAGMALGRKHHIQAEVKNTEAGALRRVNDHAVMHYPTAS